MGKVRGRIDLGPRGELSGQHEGPELRANLGVVRDEVGDQVAFARVEVELESVAVDLGEDLELGEEHRQHETGRRVRELERGRRQPRVLCGPEACEEGTRFRVIHGVGEIPADDFGGAFARVRRFILRKRCRELRAKRRGDRKDDRGASSKPNEGRRTANGQWHTDLLNGSLKRAVRRFRARTACARRCDEYTAITQPSSEIRTNRRIVLWRRCEFAQSRVVRAGYGAVTGRSRASLHHATPQHQREPP